MNQCSNCKFARSGLNDLECHRDSPKALVMLETEIVAQTKKIEPRVIWPIVSENDWCGEFQTKQK